MCISPNSPNRQFGANTYFKLDILSSNDHHVWRRNFFLSFTIFIWLLKQIQSTLVRKDFLIKHLLTIYRYIIPGIDIIDIKFNKWNRCLCIIYTFLLICHMIVCGGFSWGRNFFLDCYSGANFIAFLQRCSVGYMQRVSILLTRWTHLSDRIILPTSGKQLHDRIISLKERCGPQILA